MQRRRSPFLFSIQCVWGFESGPDCREEFRGEHAIGNAVVDGERDAHQFPDCDATIYYNWAIEYLPDAEYCTLAWIYDRQEIRHTERAEIGNGDTPAFVFERREPFSAGFLNQFSSLC